MASTLPAQTRRARTPLPRPMANAPVAPEPTPAAAPKELSVDQLKAMITSIPTKRVELYAAEVDWDEVERSGILAEKIQPWVSKKIAEYLGEEEATLVEFVIGKMSARQPASAVQAELEKVLDDEAEGFTIKLWRMLHFEAKRSAALAAL